MITKSELMLRILDLEYRVDDLEMELMELKKVNGKKKNRK